MIGWILPGAVGYLATVVVVATFLRKSGDSTFTGDELIDYIFTGFVSLLWPLYLPLFLIGILGSLMAKDNDTN